MALKRNVIFETVFFLDVWLLVSLSSFFLFFTSISTLVYFSLLPVSQDTFSWFLETPLAYILLYVEVETHTGNTTRCFSLCREFTVYSILQFCIEVMISVSSLRA